MNWVGGARNRTRLKREKKLQREHFERKRIEAIRRKDLDPTCSSFDDKELANLLHSQDLLFLNTVSISSDAEYKPSHLQRKVVHVDPDNKRYRENRRREIADVEMPVSPIAAKPSLLELDLSTNSDMSFYADPQPRVLVSTQKVPHKPVVKSFEPPTKLGNNTSQKDELMEVKLTDSLMPLESKKRKPQGTDSIYKLLGISPEKRSKHRECSESPARGANSFLSRADKEGFSMFRGHRRPKTLFDHETPFTFGPKATKPTWPYAKEHHKNGSFLLDFHREQDKRPAQHRTEHCLNQRVPQAELEEVKTARTMEAELPSAAVAAAEPEQTDAMSSAWSDVFEPSSERQVERDTTIGKRSHHDMNESIFGPIKKAKKLPRPTQTSERMMSTFEQMISSLEGKAKPKPVEMEQNVIVRKRVVTPHHNDWKNFISGISLKPPPRKKDGELADGDINGKVELPLNVQPPTKKNKEKAKVHTQIPYQLPAIKNNTSTVQELMCLDEELTSSLESSGHVVATQDLTLSPFDFAEEPIRDLFPRKELSNGNCFSSDNSQEAGDTLQADIAAEEQLKEEMLEEENGPKIAAEMAAVGRDEYASSGRGFSHCGTQTERESLKVYKEVCCECDIVSSKEEQDASIQTSPLMMHLQPSPAGQERESVATQTRQTELKDHAVQTSSTAPSPVMLSVAAQTDLSPPQTKLHDSLSHTASVRLLIGDSSHCDARLSSNARAWNVIKSLQEEVAKLKEDLGTAQSTIIWQSLQHRLHKLQ